MDVSLVFLLTIFGGLHSTLSLMLNDDMRSFSHAQKEGICWANEETTLFKRQGAPGVITEQWFASAPCFAPNAIIRYYVDDDTIPAIEGKLFLMHGIGFYNGSKAEPWGNKWLGQLAMNGGLYNTFRIPYGHSIRVTVTSPKSGIFWFILRGVDNYRVVIGDLTLPSTARLRLQKIEGKEFATFQFVEIARSKRNGLLFMVNMAGNSSDFNYLEGCFRLCSGNNTDVQFLSSGSEDFFLSAYYYNKGVYHTENSGLTYLKRPGAMSAYKIFASDPIIFRDPFNLIWRQSEKKGSGCYASYSSSGAETCEFQDGTVIPAVTEEETGSKKSRKLTYALTVISSYVWFYEW